MEKELMTRLEAAVARLEGLSAATPAPAASSGGICHDATPDKSISAFDDLVSDSLGRVLDAAGKIGGEVLDATKVLEEAFSALKQLIVESKHCQVGLPPVPFLDPESLSLAITFHFSIASQLYLRSPFFKFFDFPIKSVQW